MKKIIRLGTRASPLAIKQATLVKELLQALSVDVELMPLTTSGDRLKDKPLEAYGGKVLFTKEIEEALAANLIDLAVHSVKDVELNNPYGLVLGGVLEREDPRDAFISATGIHFHDLPLGAVIGTASPRRAAQTLQARPDIQVKLLRGNVETRLKKIENQEFDGTFLAAAGLARLDLTHKVTQMLAIEEWVPAVGQGAIGLQYHPENSLVTDLVQTLCHQETLRAIEIERAFLRGFGGSCTTPVGGHYDGQNLYVWTTQPFTKDYVQQSHYLGNLDFKAACDQAVIIGRHLAAHRGSHDSYHQAL